MEHTPVKAVPEKAQASGSRYQGAAAMRARLRDMEVMEIRTALHAFQGLISKT